MLCSTFLQLACQPHFHSSFFQKIHKVELSSKASVRILMTSRIDALEGDYSILPLKEFSRGEAVAYLLKVVGEKDSDLEEATLLASTLGCFPLSLHQAAHFIRNVPGQTFNVYRAAMESTSSPNSKDEFGDGIKEDGKDRPIGRELEEKGEVEWDEESSEGADLPRSETPPLFLKPVRTGRKQEWMDEG